MRSPHLRTSTPLCFGLYSQLSAFCLVGVFALAGMTGCTRRPAAEPGAALPSITPSAQTSVLEAQNRSLTLVRYFDIETKHVCYSHPDYKSGISCLSVSDDEAQKLLAVGYHSVRTELTFTSKNREDLVRVRDLELDNMCFTREDYKAGMFCLHAMSR